MSEIIDGIDVAECDAYKDKHCMDKTSIMFCNLNLCSNFPNCYYKQLKRMQAENKKLKNKNNDLIEEIASGNIDIAILQAENEQLKKRQITKNGFICDCEQNVKYRQALEEIKGMIQKFS